MTVVLKAITPKRLFKDSTVKTRRELKKGMDDYLDTLLDKLRVYPPQQRPERQRFRRGELLRLETEAAMRGEEFRPPARFRPYKRTGRLMRGWKKAPVTDGSTGFVFNRTRYAVYVQGPHGGGRVKGERQTKLNRGKGWLSITDAARETRRQFVTVMNRSIQGGVRLS